MYVVHGIVHPYHENSASWVIDVYSEERLANELVEKLNAICGPDQFGLDKVGRKILLDIHPRAVPDLSYESDKFVSWFFGNDDSIIYFVSDLSLPCIPNMY